MFCHFSIRYPLGQVWYLIVSIPDLCLLPYFVVSVANESMCMKYCLTASSKLVKTNCGLVN